MFKLFVVTYSLFTWTGGALGVSGGVTTGFTIGFTTGFTTGFGAGFTTGFGFTTGLTTTVVTFRYFVLTYPVFEPYFTLDQEPLFDTYVTIFPFGIVSRDEDLIEAPVRRFKFAVTV
jgi:hypothetical protein